MAKVLVLKTVKEDMAAWGGFLWKEKGVVKAPDWDPRPICGGGLHGYLWGEGDGDSILRDPNTKWLVLSVDEFDIVDLGGKVKFPKCSVVYCGDRIGATEKILKKRPESICIEASKTVGDYQTVIVGAHGFATAGHKGTAIAGRYGTATAGNFGIAIAGFGKAKVGFHGSINIKYWDGNRHRTLVGYEGEDIEANVFYRVEDGKFVKV